MEVLQALYLLLRLTAHDAHRPRCLNDPVRPEADKGYSPILLRHFLRTGAGVDLIVGAVLLADFGVVVEAVKFPITQAVLALLPFGRFEDRRQRIAEVYRADFFPLGGSDLRLMSRPVVHQG